METFGENVPTSRMTNCVPFESTSKFTSVATFDESFTNSIFMPLLVDVSGMPATDGAFELLERSGPQLLMVTGDADGACCAVTAAGVPPRATRARTGIKRLAISAPPEHTLARPKKTALVTNEGRRFRCAAAVALTRGDLRNDLPRFLRANGFCDIGLADDADDLPIVFDHGNAPNLMRRHEIGGVLDGIFGTNRDEISLLELAGGDAVHVAPSGDDLHDDIAVGQHPLDDLVLVGDRQGADVVLREPLGGVADRFLFLNHRYVLAHNVQSAGRHVETSSVSGCKASRR